jgi:hypothetical protein
MLIKVYFHFMTSGAFIVTTDDTKDYDSKQLGTQEDYSVQNILKVCILLSCVRWGGGTRDN